MDHINLCKGFKLQLEYIFTIVFVVLPCTLIVQYALNLTLPLQTLHCLDQVVQ